MEGHKKWNITFSVKSSYSYLIKRRANRFPPAIVWNPWAPTRVSFFYLGGNLDHDHDTGSAQKEGRKMPNIPHLQKKKKKHVIIGSLSKSS